MENVLPATDFVQKRQSKNSMIHSRVTWKMYVRRSHFQPLSRKMSWRTTAYVAHVTSTFSFLFSLSGFRSDACFKWTASPINWSGHNMHSMLQNRFRFGFFCCFFLHEAIVSFLFIFLNAMTHLASFRFFFFFFFYSVLSNEKSLHLSQGSPSTAIEQLPYIPQRLFS